MNGILCTKESTLTIAPGDVHELVRGHEQILLERMTPLVRQQNVLLDMALVERVDAAGIAALISLYACAQSAGHTFTVSNASPRIEEILALVGLDHILISHSAVPDSPAEPCFGRPAA